MNTVSPNLYNNSAFVGVKSQSNEVFYELQCSHFIPKTQTTCYCGLEYKEHTTEAIGVYSTSSNQNINWNSEECTSKRESRCRGVLLTYRHGIINQSLYLRLAYNSEAISVSNYLKTCWRNRTRTWSGPSLVLNLCAGNKTQFGPSQKRRILEVLSDILTIGNVLVITSAIHTGFTELLGKCVDQRWTKTGENTRVLGICNWGIVMENEDLVRQHHSGSKSVLSNYHIDSKPDNGRFWLHSNVTDFLLVDDGTCLDSDDVIVSFTSRLLEQFELEVPVANLVFDDSEFAMKICGKALETNQNIYVIERGGSKTNVLSGLIDALKSDTGSEFSIEEVKSHALLGPDQQETIQDSILSKINSKESLISQIFKIPLTQNADLAVNFVLNRCLESISDPFKKLQKTYLWNRASVCEDVCVSNNLDSNQEIDALVEASRCLVDGNAQFCRIYVSFNLLDFDYFGHEDRLCKLYKEVFQSNESLILSKIFMNFLPAGKFPFSFDKPLDSKDVDQLKLFLKKVSSKLNLDVKIHFEGDLEERRVKNSMRELFIFSLLTEKYELAEELWIYLPNKITTCLFAAAVLTQIGSRFHKRKLDLQKNFEEVEKAGRHFEAKASEMIEFCHRRDPDRTGACMKIKYPDWSDMDMAGFAQSCGSSREFLSTEACTHFTQQRWYHFIHPGEHMAKIGLCAVFPFLCVLLLLDVDDNHEDKLTKRLKSGHNAWKRTKRFYRCPVTIFMLNQLYNLIFVVLFGVMICQEQDSDFMALEIAILSYAGIQVLEKMRYVVLFRVTGSKNWTRIPLIISLSAYILLLAAFVCRLIPGSDQDNVAQCLYILSFCMFACKSMQMSFLSKSVGRKMIILQQMLPDLMHYALIMLLFSILYGVASLALIMNQFGELDDFIYWWMIVFRPVLQLFGDLYLEDLQIVTSPGSEKSLPSGFEGEVVVALVLMCVYLLIVGVLLLTWLIAVFVNKYRQLEIDAHKLLLIQQYYLVHEYFERSAVPPPFVIIPFSVFWLKAIYKQKLPDGSDFTRGYKNNVREIPQLIQWESGQISDLLRMKKTAKSEHLFQMEATSADTRSDSGDFKSENTARPTLKPANESGEAKSFEMFQDILSQQTKKLETIGEQIALTQYSIQSLKERKSRRKSRVRDEDQRQESSLVSRSSSAKK